MHTYSSLKWPWLRQEPVIITIIITSIVVSNSRATSFPHLLAWGSKITIVAAAVAEVGANVRGVIVHFSLA